MPPDFGWSAAGFGLDAGGADLAAGVSTAGAFVAATDAAGFTVALGADAGEQDTRKTDNAIKQHSVTKTFFDRIAKPPFKF